MCKTSGATYAGVPQQSKVSSAGVPSFDKPKSVILILNSSSDIVSIRIFSGLRSL